MKAQHKTHEQLHTELTEANNKIKIGEVYRHFKSKDSKYKILALAFNEGNDELNVVYQNVNNPELVFTRSLKNWFDKKEYEGETVTRFILIK